MRKTLACQILLPYMICLLFNIYRDRFYEHKHKTTCKYRNDKSIISVLKKCDLLAKSLNLSKPQFPPH